MDEELTGGQQPAAAGPPGERARGPRRARRRRAALGIGGTVLAGGMAAAGYSAAGAVTAGGSPAAAPKTGAVGAAAPEAAGALPTAATGATGSSAGASSGTTAPPAARRLRRPGLGLRDGMLGPAGNRGLGGLDGLGSLGLRGVVTAATVPGTSSPGSITITEADGTSVSVTTTASTTYRNGTDLRLGLRVGTPVTGARSSAPPASASASVVVVGVDVVIVPTRSSAAATTPTASEVVIEPQVIGGTVVSVGSATIVVRDAQLAERTVEVGASTAYLENGSKVAPSAVTVGAEILATGTLASDQTSIDATEVEVVALHVAGRVASVSSSGFSLTLPDGTPVTVSTAAASFSSAGGATASLSTLRAGDVVLVTGLRQRGGALAASTVEVVPAASAQPGPGGAPPGPGSGPASPLGPGTAIATGSEPPFTPAVAPAAGA